MSISANISLRTGEDIGDSENQIAELLIPFLNNVNANLQTVDKSKLFQFVLLTLKGIWHGILTEFTYIVQNYRVDSLQILKLKALLC